MPQIVRHRARISLAEPLPRASSARGACSHPRSRSRLWLGLRRSHWPVEPDRAALVSARDRRRDRRAPQGTRAFLRNARPPRHRASDDVSQASRARRRLACQDLAREEARRRRRKPCRAAPSREGCHRSLLSGAHRGACRIGAVHCKWNRCPRARLQRAVDVAPALKTLALWRGGVSRRRLSFTGAADNGGGREACARLCDQGDRFRRFSRARGRAPPS